MTYRQRQLDQVFDGLAEDMRMSSPTRRLAIRRLVRLIPQTYLAEYRETYSDGQEFLVTMSYLWDRSPESLERRTVWADHLNDDSSTDEG